MGIFSDDQIVVGLFDNDSAAEETIEELSKHGFGGEDSDESVEVYNRYRFEPVDDTTEYLVAQPSPGSGSPAGIAAAAPPTDRVKTDHSTVRRRVADEFKEAGIDDEQSTYFAERVARGGVVITVKAEGDRIAEASDIVQKRSSKHATLT